MNLKTKFIGLLLLAVALLTSIPARAATLNDWTLLSAEEQARYGFTHIMVLDATNCTVLRTNGINSLFPAIYSSNVTFTAGTRIRNVAAKVVTPFGSSGGTITALLLSVGDGALTNRYLSGSGIGTNIAANTWYVGVGTNVVYNAATNVSVNLTSTGDVVGTLTTGRLELYISAVDLNRLNNN